MWRPLFQVGPLDSFWEWAEQTFIPVMFSRVDYGGEKVPRGATVDGVNFLVGSTRLRQVRAKQSELLWVKAHLLALELHGNLKLRLFMFYGYVLLIVWNWPFLLGECNPATYGITQYCTDGYSAGSEDQQSYSLSWAGQHGCTSLTSYPYYSTLHYWNVVSLRPICPD